MLVVITLLTLYGYPPQPRDFCKRIPAMAWSVSIERAVSVAHDVYGVEEPELSKLRACLMKPMPK